MKQKNIKKMTRNVAKCFLQACLDNSTSRKGLKTRSKKVFLNTLAGLGFIITKVDETDFIAFQRMLSNLKTWGWVVCENNKYYLTKAGRNIE